MRAVWAAAVVGAVAAERDRRRMPIRERNQDMADQG
jgi:hypothetical protein